ncbi:hypothetical protein [Glycomyces xiaoerkulensis]|uniref:hypothetical protein n=1 Tax=Glycomyces xiaoerkulensis TaxID=2038139 RepID=UPI000C25B120|nr:hypothetical protein [Glycomyces xiaoerkulensis]
MNSTPHPPDKEHTQPADQTSDYWLTEYPESGLERNWAELRRPYTAEMVDRKRIAAAIDNVRWHRLNAAVAISPGLILRAIIPEAQRAGFQPLAMGIGADPIDYPEPHLLDQPRREVHPDYFETGYLLGLRRLVRRTVFSAYFLVLTDEAGLVVFDRDDRPIPEGLLTNACAARLHELCKGTVDGSPCECPCRQPEPKAS